MADGRLKVSVLGGLAASYDGQPVDLGGRRQRSVLALLLLARGDAVSAEELMDRLWAGDVPTAATSSLHAFISHLRRRLQPDLPPRSRSGLLASVARGYALRLDPDAVDAWRFERLLTEGSAAVASDPGHAAAVLEEALALWQGPAYADYLDEEWAEAETARLADLREVARERLLAARMETTESAVLVPELEALVAAEPLREERWRLLVLALYRAHRQGDALLALRRARHTLAEELGVDPGPALRELEAEVLAQSPSLAATGTPVARPRAQTQAEAPAPVATELVERERDLARLQALVAGATRGDDGGCAFVEGPAGIGKSRLMAEVRGLATRAGARVLHARGSQLEQEFSLGVVRQLLEPALRDPALRDRVLQGAAAAVGQLLSGEGEMPSEGVDDSSYAALHGLYWAVNTLASERPLVLVVDDLHWCDSSSVRFLVYLTRRLEGLPLVLVLGLRTGEEHPLGALIREIEHDPATVLVRPRPLTAQGVRAVVRAELGEDAHDDFSRACFEATRGNPLLVRQLLRALESDGVPPHRSRVDTVRALGSRAVSNMILLRLRRMPVEAQAVARALAVLGDGAGLPLVATLAGLDEDAAASVTTELSRAEIARPEPPLGFVHALVRDAVYGDIPTGERELLHDRAARLLHEAGRSAEQVAAQLLPAPRRGNAWAVETLRRAAAQATRYGGADGAATYLRRALEEPPAEDLRPQILLELGITETRIDGASARASLQAAYDTLSDPADRALAATALARTLVFAGPPGAPTRFARAARRDLPADLVDEQQALLALERMGGYMHGLPPEDYEYDETPVISGHGVGARMLRVTVSWESFCRAESHEPVRALAQEAIEDGSLMAFDPGLFWVVALNILELCEADVLPMWEAAHRRAHERGSLFAVLASSLWYGFARLRRGELAEAEHLLAAAIEQFETWDPQNITVPYAMAHLGRVLIEVDRFDEAEVVLGRDFPEAGGDSLRMLAATQATLALARGLPEVALAHVEWSAAAMPHVVNPAWREDRMLRARALHGLGRTDEALEIAQELLGHARRLGTTGAIGEVLRHVGAFRGSVDDLREATALLADSPLHLQHAHALVDLGAALLATDPDEGRARLAEALALADRFGAALVRRRVAAVHAQAGLPAPATSGAVNPHLSLTQRRIVDLVVSGSTVRDVAQELFLPPSSVERRLDEVRRSFGVESLDALADEYARRTGRV